MTDLQIVDEIKANKWEYTEYCFLCLSKYYTKFACMMTHSRKIFISISAYSAKLRSENVHIRNILYESCIPTFVGIHPAFLDKKNILPIPTSGKVGSNVHQLRRLKNHHNYPRLPCHLKVFFYESD